MSITALQIEMQQKMAQLSKETRTFEITASAEILAEDLAEISEKLWQAIIVTRREQLARHSGQIG